MRDYDAHEVGNTTQMEMRPSGAPSLGLSEHAARWLRMRGELPNGDSVQGGHPQPFKLAHDSSNTKPTEYGTPSIYSDQTFSATWKDLRTMLREKDKLIASLSRERDQRVEEKEQKVQQLSGQVGFLQAKLQDTEKQLKLLQHPGIEVTSISPDNLQQTTDDGAPNRWSRILATFRR